MANQKELDLLKQGSEVWNNWREKHPTVVPDFSHADSINSFGTYDLERVNFSKADISDANLSFMVLTNANLSGTILCRTSFCRTYLDNANLSGADLREAFFEGATFEGINLSGADLRGATFVESSISGDTLNYVNFSKVNLSGANLSCMDLCEFNFRGANLRGANLREADLRWANLSEADLSGADLTGCRVYGTSIWKVRLENTQQTGLIITQEGEPVITVDNLKVAQFIYLLLENEEIRDVIDTITSKVVLILGRFTPKRKVILNVLRDQLRIYNYSPVLFDFDKPETRDFTETVRTLAHMSRFIIADITDPSSIPQELQAIVPDLAVPIQPILQESTREYAMFKDFRKYHWVLPLYLYKNSKTLILTMKHQIIEKAEEKSKEIIAEKYGKIL